MLQNIVSIITWKKNFLEHEESLGNNNEFYRLKNVKLLRSIELLTINLNYNDPGFNESSVLTNNFLIFVWFYCKVPIHKVPNPA